MVWTALALIFAVGAAYQFTNPVNVDVSWLIVLGEKVLGGARLYVDVIEANPPMSVFLYLPAVALEHLTGIGAETLTVLLMFGLIAASLALCARILRSCGGEPEALARFVVMAALVLAVMPMAVFAEREHIALALMLPSILILTARVEGGSIGNASRLAAGLAAGLAVAIKPQFAAALALPSLYLAIGKGSLRPLFALENWLTAAVVLLYGAIVVLCFPVYGRDMLPMLFDTYRALNFPLSALLLNPSLLITAGVAVATLLIAGRDASRPQILIPLLAALGFSLSFIEQGKGWIYHLYPAIGLVFIVFLCQALPRLAALLNGPRRYSVHSGLMAGLALAVGFGFLHLVAVMKERNSATIAIAERVRATFTHPKVLTISADLSIGHPFTRLVEGNWVGTFGCQFLSTIATALAEAPSATPATKARMAGWIARDRAILAHDLREGRPDVVLVDPKSFPWDDLVASDSEAAVLLGRYQQIASINAIKILILRDRVSEVVAKGAFAP